MIAATLLAGTAHAAGFKYVWTGGAPGYSGFIVLDSPSSSSGSVSNILAAQITTPEGTYDFNPATVYASRPLFTWNSTQITYMFFAWNTSAPYTAFGANFDYNNNGTLHTYILSEKVNTTQYLDESGSWMAASSVNDTAPTITSNPTSRVVTSRGLVTFAATANGAPAPTYQWKKDGIVVYGATSSSLTISNVKSADAGSYTLVATNYLGSATSGPATLLVNPEPPTDPQPKGITLKGKITSLSGAYMTTRAAVGDTFTITAGFDASLPPAGEYIQNEFTFKYATALTFTLGNTSFTTPAYRGASWGVQSWGGANQVCGYQLQSDTLSNSNAPGLQFDVLMLSTNATLVPNPAAGWLTTSRLLKKSSFD